MPANEQNLTNYSKLNSIEDAINDIRLGKVVVVVDDENRENEGDFITAAETINSSKINFMAKNGRGLICLALDSLQAKRLNLSLMSTNNQSRNKTAFTISIEAKKGITTEILAADALLAASIMINNSMML